MRPRSYARRLTDAHMYSRTRLRTYTYIHPCTHTYARIRAREGIFLTTNLLYSIVKPSSIINTTPFTSIIQSLYNPYPYWYHIGCGICTNCCHLSSSDIHYQPSITIVQPLPNYPHPFTHLSLISHLLSLPSIISNKSSHLYPISNPTYHPIIMSVYYKTLSILYVFAALPIYFLIYDSFSSYTDYYLYQPNYNHFHYGNRNPR